ncbi:MAG: hypothetical protein WED07_07455 [Candidatus Freyarchaeum deiterrae]
MPDKKKEEEDTKKFLRETRKAVPKMKEEIKKRETRGETDAAASLSVFPNELLDIAREKERLVKDVPVSCFNCPLSKQYDGSPCTVSSPGLCKEIESAINDLFEGKAQKWFGFKSKEAEMFEGEEEKSQEKSEES